ncbi:hypothetical protein ACJ73_03496 [Blastomyces percursus]|uniref:KfrA N-terminal DNA-binding domain-containing protein n=1 Tax=Blastomyces percursus TaxID=1658174 RepID=A0A1J9QY52_9EURO|nr:hypothetical protein ACJ73_03496 [Blastomyces percursus]
MDLDSNSRRPAQPPSRAENTDSDRSSCESGAVGPQGCTLASAEKHAIAISEVWKNEGGCYSGLSPHITSHDRTKAEGLLATISAKRYHEVATALNSAPVDGWKPAFHQWLSMFRSHKTHQGPRFDPVSDTIEELEQLAAQLREQKAELDDLEADCQEHERLLQQRREHLDNRKASIEERASSLQYGFKRLTEGRTRLTEG